MKAASVILSLLMVALTTQPLLHEIYHQHIDEAVCSCCVPDTQENDDQDHVNVCNCDSGCSDQEDGHQCNHDCHCPQKTAPVYTSFDLHITKFFEDEVELNTSFINTYSYTRTNIIWHPPMLS